MLWHGEETSFSGPQAATKAGIATIYQELDLVERHPERTVKVHLDFAG